MNNPIVKNILRIGFFILLQALVVNRLDLFQGLALPFIYIFALLMLPIQTPRLLVLLICFVVGICMDAFTNTIGMHTSACTLLGFLIPPVNRLLAPREGYEFAEKPTIQDLGITWYLTFAGILTLAHHSWLFFVEALSFDFLGHTLLKIVVSSVFTLGLMILAQYLIFRPDNRARK